MKKGQKSLKLTVYLALLVAISIIMGKYLAIRGGDIMRFSLENMPIIFAGMAFGPICGVAVGVVGDLVGCLMVGYTINPLVTIGAGAIGLLSGLCARFCNKLGISGPLKTVTAVSVAHILGSVIIKTAGLAAYYTIPFSILLLYRFLNYVIVGALDGVIVHVLLKNPAISAQVKEVRNNDL